MHDLVRLVIHFETLIAPVGLLWSHRMHMPPVSPARQTTVVPSKPAAHDQPKAEVRPSRSAPINYAAAAPPLPRGVWVPAPPRGNSALYTGLRSAAAVLGAFAASAALIFRGVFARTALNSTLVAFRGSLLSLGAGLSAPVVVWAGSAALLTVAAITAACRSGQQAAQSVAAAAKSVSDGARKSYEFVVDQSAKAAKFAGESLDGINQGLRNRAARLAEVNRTIWASETGKEVLSIGSAFVRVIKTVTLAALRAVRVGLSALLAVLAFVSKLPSMVLHVVPGLKKGTSGT